MTFIVTKQTVSLSELLQDINNFSKTIVDVIRKSHEFSFKIVWVIKIVVLNHVNFLVKCQPMTSEHCLLPADTWWCYDMPPSCCWVCLPIFFTPWSDLWLWENGMGLFKRTIFVVIRFLWFFFKLWLKIVMVSRTMSENFRYLRWKLCLWLAFEVYASSGVRIMMAQPPQRFHKRDRPNIW